MTAKPRKPLLAVLAAAIALTIGLGALLFAAMLGAGAVQIVHSGRLASPERDAEMMWRLALVTTLLLALAAVSIGNAIRIWRRWPTGDQH